MNKKIYSNHLPGITGGFFGRNTELKLLDEAWTDKNIRVAQFFAPGGTGKTELLHHWLNQTSTIDTLIAWSFYSQGSDKDKHISATSFFSHAFRLLNAERTTFVNEEDKGSYLAELLQQSRSVLVLDGLEPLQHSDKEIRGELKDRAIRQLLKKLIGYNAGLCIITTRIALPELYDNNQHVISKELGNLVPEDGVRLLQSLGVDGNQTELKKVAKECNCHALTLHLLGSALHTYLDDKAGNRGSLVDITDKDDAAENLIKIIQAYSQKLKDTPELKLLQLLGLFDRPVDAAVLQELFQSQIPNLTADIDLKTWETATKNLRDKHRLLVVNNDNPDQLDCHPLLREYLGQQLRESQPDAWTQAHALLFKYYNALPEKELPDTLEEMQPLFNAVAHGCAAGLHQQALHEVFNPRIRRKNQNYLIRQLNAISDDLATLAHFFSEPWHTPTTILSQTDQIYILASAGFDLSVLGRLREALEPMQTSIETYIKQGLWSPAAISMGNLCNLQLTLGEIDNALNSGERSMDYAERSGDINALILTHATHANVLHQSGDATFADQLFRDTEHFQKQHHPKYPYLYSVQGFYYCDLLLSQGDAGEALKRTKQTLKWARESNNFSPLSIALDQFTLGRAYLLQENFPDAASWLDHALMGIRNAGVQDYVVRCLLERASLHRNINYPDYNFTLARQDLQEAYNIAKPSGMLLHLVDYHLEMARLLLTEQTCSAQPPTETDDKQELPVQEHVSEASRLIDKTGYKRRLPELQVLQNRL